jgi:hypothetical protein
MNLLVPIKGFLNLFGIDEISLSIITVSNAITLNV